ncbi:MAG TPA: GNAT family N-acetyltransferase [Blastocatellia bacterium]|nr:GNAT family N-acetyltransferase [Blastocatellia bacterium]
MNRKVFGLMQEMQTEGKRVTVKRTYLQLLQQSDLKGREQPKLDGLRVDQVLKLSPSFYRFLYREVGRPHHWVDRLPWTDIETASHLSRPELTLWVMYLSGAPAGFFELERHKDTSTEIAYFGLLPEYTGLGLGKYLLTRAVEEAWATGANRVWLHTCTLDHPAALPNYVKRGFAPFKEESYDTFLEPWEVDAQIALSPPAT